MADKIKTPGNGIGWINAPAHISKNTITRDYSLTVYFASYQYNGRWPDDFDKAFIQGLPKAVQLRVKALFEAFLSGEKNQIEAAESLSQAGDRSHATPKEIEGIKYALENFF